jgi:hypothetical protein
LINAAKGSSNRYINCLDFIFVFLFPIFKFWVNPCNLNLCSFVTILVAATPSRRRMRSSVLPRPTVEWSLCILVQWSSCYVVRSCFGSCFTWCLDILRPSWGFALNEQWKSLRYVVWGQKCQVPDLLNTRSCSYMSELFDACESWWMFLWWQTAWGFRCLQLHS